MSVPYSFEDTLRVHDTAVHRWLAGLLVNYDNIAGVPRIGVPILVVQSTPQRAFSVVPDLLVSRQWISGATADEMRANAENNFDVLPLPLCTITRGEPEVDYTRSGPPKAFANRFIDVATQKWVKHRWPGMYLVAYNFTFWMKKRYTEAYIREWIMSQLGEVGAGPGEFFIQVDHQPPWGSIPQAMKFQGSSDLSDLEGEAQRYIRFEFQFTLQMMHMHPAEPATGDDGYPVTSFQTQVCGMPGNIRPGDNATLGALTGGFKQSDNLFAVLNPPDDIPLWWPKTGAAAVSASSLSPDGKTYSLRAVVNTPDDSVELAERPVHLDGQGEAVVQVSFAYLSDADAEVEISQRDPIGGVLSTMRTVALPSTGSVWRRVNLYTLASDPIVAVSIVGVGVLARVHVSDIDIRHIYSQGFVAFTDKVVVGPNVQFRWTGLPNAPLMVRARLGVTPGPVSFTLRNDVSAPTIIDTVLIDSAENVGYASLVQPVAGSLSLEVPGLVTLASVALHRYGGHYHPNEV